MKYCENCGIFNQRNANYCMECGEKLPYVNTPSVLNLNNYPDIERATFVKDLINFINFGSPELKLDAEYKQNILISIANYLEGNGNKKSADLLLSALKYNNYHVKSNIEVIFALDGIEPQNTMDLLIMELKKEDIHIKRRTIYALGEKGDLKALDPLIKMLNDKNAFVRSQAVIALGKLGDKKAINPIIKTLNDKTLIVKKDSIRVLGELGGKNVIKYLEKFTKDKNESVRKVALDSIKKIQSKYTKSNVPEWKGYYPNLESANSEQKEFYNKWLSGLDKDNYIDIEGNLCYIFVYLYDTVNKFIENEDIDYLLNSFEKIRIGYCDKEEKLNRYLIDWKSDAFLYINKEKEALELLIEKKEFFLRNIMEYVLIKEDHTLNLINGYHMMEMTNYQGLTSFGQDNKDEIANIATELLKEFQRKIGKPIINYFLEEFQLSNLSIEDLSTLKSYFKNENNYLKFKELYKQEKKEGITYPGFLLSKNLEFHGFLGVPLSYPEKYMEEVNEHHGVITSHYQRVNPEFEKRISPRSTEKIYVPGIVVEALKNQFKIFLRESENLLRVERDLPRVGEGWISETELFYKIKKTFAPEEVIHHGRPPWLGRQHLDIYFPKHNIGIEYQGDQHADPIEYFGGEEGFKKRKELDERKKKLCEQNGCKLVYVYPDYDFKNFKRKMEKLL